MSNANDTGHECQERTIRDPRGRLLALAERIGATVHPFGDGGLIVILDPEPAVSVDADAPPIATALQVPQMTADDFAEWFEAGEFPTQAAAADFINKAARSAGRVTHYSTSDVGLWLRGERKVPQPARIIIFSTR